MNDFTVKALTAIASSPLRVDLRVILADSLPVLSSFLRSLVEDNYVQKEGAGAKGKCPLLNLLRWVIPPQLKITKRNNNFFNAPYEL